MLGSRHLRQRALHDVQAPVQPLPFDSERHEGPDHVVVRSRDDVHQTVLVQLDAVGLGEGAKPADVADLRELSLHGGEPLGSAPGDLDGSVADDA